MSTSNPLRAICGTVMYPLLNTIALGGVPAGNIKPNEADMVTASIRGNGSIPKLPLVAARIGKRMLAVAVFEATSVNATAMKLTASSAMKGCRSRMELKFDAIEIESARMSSPRYMRILQRRSITYNQQVKIRLRVALILLALLLGSRTHAGHRATQDVDQDLSASLTHLAYSVFTLVYMNA